ncbi:MAG: HD domain-containing protein [archaeon]|nr:HD domain-containing protein [archaeon]
MIVKKWEELFLKEAEDQLKTAPKISPVHKTDHLLRVLKKSKILCKKLNGDLEIMVATVLLHDLGRHLGFEIHGEKSAELAKPILEKHGFPEEKIPKVLEAISQHDYTFPQEKRHLIESKILYDCDKMDALGVVGVYRHIIFYMEKKQTPINEILAMLEKRFNGLVLDESKELAKPEYEYIINFFKILGEELGDEK